MVESKTAETALGLRVRRMNTPLGEIIALAEDDALRGLWFRGQKYEGMGGGDPALWQRGEAEDPVFRSLERWLDEYFAGQRRKFTIPYTIYAAPFYKRALEEVAQIPYGEVASYRDIALALGTRAYRAVGTAVKHNYLAIIIPCHRVISSDGSIGGYSFYTPSR